MRKTPLPKSCSKIIGTDPIRIVRGRPKRYGEVTEGDIEQGLIQVGKSVKIKRGSKIKVPRHVNVY